MTPSLLAALCLASAPAARAQTVEQVFQEASQESAQWREHRKFKVASIKSFLDLPGALHAKTICTEVGCDFIVAFDRWEDLAAARASGKLPRQLRDARGIPYGVRALVDRESLERDYPALIRKHNARFADLPGVVKAEAFRGEHEHTLTVLFDGRESLKAARAAGLLPEKVPDLEGIGFTIKASVHPDADKKETASLEAAYRALFLKITGVVGVSLISEDYAGTRLFVIFDSERSLALARAAKALPAHVPNLDGWRYEIVAKTAESEKR